MMLRLFTIIAIVKLPQISANNPVEGYYWRDFNDTIPPDAFVGGNTDSNEPLYVGQAFHEKELCVGEISTADKKIHIDWKGKDALPTEEKKILCSRQPYQFRWLYIETIDNLPLLENQHFLLGGVQENSYTLLIGRYTVGKRHYISKVLTDKDRDSNGFYYTDGKQEYKVKEGFEILSFIAERT